MGGWVRGRWTSWDTGRVDDKPPIHIESKVTTEGAGAGLGDHTSGPWSSTSRVVRGPGRWSRLAGVVAVVGLLAGGLLWWANDGARDDDGAGRSSCSIGGDRVRADRIASGSTHARLTADGRVIDLSTFRGPVGPFVLGPGAVLRLDPQAEMPDAGRCVIRAMVPAADPHDAFGKRLSRSNLLLTLDEDGNIARIVVRSAPDDPERVIKLDTREGEPQSIAPPHRGR
jgi:hypothetical protein